MQSNRTQESRQPEAAAISERWRELLDVLPVSAYVCDAAGLILHFNAIAARIWGRTPELRNADDRFCASHQLYSPMGTPIPRDECWMARALAHGRAYHGRSIIVERPDGGRTYGVAYAHPFRDQRGHTVGALTLLAEIAAQPHNGFLAMIDVTIAMLTDIRWTRDALV
jgi:PAS domain-containing protein